MPKKLICNYFRSCDNETCDHRKCHKEQQSCVNGWCKRVNNYVACTYLSSLSESDRLALAMEDL